MRWFRGSVGRTAGVVMVVLAGAAVAACAADGDDSMRSIAESGSSLAPVPVSDDTTPMDTTEYPANGETADVLSIDNNFMPQTLQVTAGTTVHWRNNGRNDHNVIPADDPTASTWGVLEDMFAPKDEYSFTFTRAGTFVYYCSIHGTATAGMFGAVVVTAP